ncbi:hypothetical protein GCM10025738_08950 [Microbacterium fluvii]
MDVRLAALEHEDPAPFEFGDATEPPVQPSSAYAPLILIWSAERPLAQTNQRAIRNGRADRAIAHPLRLQLTCAQQPGPGSCVDNMLRRHEASMPIARSRRDRKASDRVQFDARSELGRSIAPLNGARPPVTVAGAGPIRCREAPRGHTADSDLHLQLHGHEHTRSDLPPRRRMPWIRSGSRAQ